MADVHIISHAASRQTCSGTVAIVHSHACCAYMTVLLLINKGEVCEGVGLLRRLMTLFPQGEVLFAVAVIVPCCAQRAQSRSKQEHFVYLDVSGPK